MSILDKPRTPTPQELHRYGRYVRAATDPGSLVDDLENGAVFPESVETWQRLFPQELEQLQMLIKSQVQNSKNEGDYTPQQKRNLALVLGEPIDNTYQNQLATARKAEEQQGQSPRASRANVSPLPEAYKTRLERLLGG